MVRMNKATQSEERTSKGELQLRVNPNWCKRCGICVAFCPKEALGKDQDDLPCWKDQNACNRCRLCENWCPDFAIEILMEEEGDDAPKE